MNYDKAMDVAIEFNPSAFKNKERTVENVCFSKEQ